MRNKLLIAIALFTFLFGISVQHLISYPKTWNQVHLGMTKQEAYKILDEPQQYWTEKGAFWGNSDLIRIQELEIHFEDNKVYFLNIKQRIGSSRTFYIMNLHSESYH